MTELPNGIWLSSPTPSRSDIAPGGRTLWLTTCQDSLTVCGLERGGCDVKKRHSSSLHGAALVLINVHTHTMHPSLTCWCRYWNSGCTLDPDCTWLFIQISYCLLFSPDISHILIVYCLLFHVLLLNCLCYMLAQSGYWELCRPTRSSYDIAGLFLCGVPEKKQIVVLFFLCLLRLCLLFN